ncbi:MAG: tetratricopeptide repeat protein [Candidatus Omnitrophica bacterium]|nr:tetratricopeptide repeat protein [Candidatus Omnitrophota bacterium]
MINKEKYCILVFTLSLFIMVVFLTSCENSKTNNNYAIKGDVYYDQKQYDKAIEAYKKAIDMGEYAVNAYNNLGLIYHYEKNDYKAAKEIYERGLSIYQNRESLLSNLMNTELELGNIEKALHLYETLAQRKNKRGSLGIHVEKLNQLMQQRNYSEQEQLATYSRILKANPNDLMINFEIGMHYSKNKDYNKAIAVYKKVIELNSEHLSAYTQLASAYAVLEDYSNALLYYEKAIELGADIPVELIDNLRLKIDQSKNDKDS